MYCSAISTRLLVGMFTPAIRATALSPVAGIRPAVRLLLPETARPQTRTRRLPHGSCGARHRLKQSDWMSGLLRYSATFRQLLPPLSSRFLCLLGNLFSRVFGLCDLAGSRPGFGFGRALGLGLCRAFCGRF